LGQLKNLFTQVLLANEERGKEATGVAASRPDGSVLILKRPICASAFVQTKEYQWWMDAWDEEVCTLLGHTRKPTKGSVWNPHNNHPIQVGRTVGIHNGTIRNDVALFRDAHLERTAEVDSEIIFSLLERSSQKDPQHLLTADIQQISRQLTGQFTTLSFHLLNPEELLVLKYNQPVSFHYCPTLDSYFFSSRYLFLRKAFGRQVVTEALPSRTGYVFNARKVGYAKGQPLRQFPLKSADD
jgi:glucosamine 6-phosphate synthetase-like amidotransferase/phosphosugar isomerase protein